MSSSTWWSPSRRRGLTPKHGRRRRGSALDGGATCSRPDGWARFQLLAGVRPYFLGCAQARPASPWATRSLRGRAPVQLDMDAYVRVSTPSPCSPPRSCRRLGRRGRPGGPVFGWPKTSPVRPINGCPDQSTGAEAAKAFPVPSADEPAGVRPRPPSSPRPWRRWHPAPARPRLPHK